ncbi:MAG: type IV secretory system conjugative DNA transfer family protein [Clostridia bacterium]|nr:type IV secretory system conjugative DNA transfer family protein [Clostridia bacterium]
MVKERDNVILGDGCVYPMGGQVNDNIVVVGGTGCGKTMSISEPRLLETKHTSLVITLSKRKLVKKYAPLFYERGYNVWDMNFADPTAGNISYDPLAYLRTDSDIRYLAESIVKANPQKRNKTSADPYWDDAAISLLCAEIAFVRYRKGARATFADVVDLNNTLTVEEYGGQIRTSLDKVFDLLATREPTHYAVICWRSFRSLPIRTASCVFGALNVTLDTIFTKELCEMIRMPKRVDFETLSTEKTILFITTSAVNPALNSFINLFYGTCFKALFEFAEKRPDGTLPIPVHILCDDFAVGCKVNNFEQNIAIFREKGISVTILLQSESQLGALYGADEATTIINNADTYIYMGGMDLKTCRAMSEKCNIPLDDILYMPIGRIVILRRGQRPIYTTRYNILENELYRKIEAEYERSLNPETPRGFSILGQRRAC